MDTITLVENQIEDGQRFLDRLVKEGIVVRAACWVKPYDQDRWTLAIATPLLDEKGPMGAYGQALSVLRSLGQGWITSSDIKLVGDKDGFVNDVLDLQKRFPDKAFLSPKQSLGSIPVEDVYIYSLEKVPVTIYGMKFRGEPSGCLHLSFEPHNPNSWLEMDDNQGHRGKYLAETGIDWFVDTPAGSTLARNKIGLLELVWDFRGNRTTSDANSVLALAELELNGFRIVQEPAQPFHSKAIEV